MKRPPQPLTSEEARSLLDQCGGGRVGLRNRALVVVLWRCGLRAFEACGLELKDLAAYGKGYRVTVLRPKGHEKGKPPRVIGVAYDTKEILDEWIVIRGEAPGPLFTTSNRQVIQTSYLRQLLPQLARRAGIHRRVHPHALRHTFAQELYDETKDIRLVQAALGHDNISTTERYLAAIGATQMVSVTSARTFQ